MTTASKRTSTGPRTGTSAATAVAPILLGAAAVTTAVGLSLALAGGLTQGSSAAYAALLGTAVVVTIFGLGSGVVNVVAAAMPAASLMFALLTYLLQLVLLMAILVAVERSGALDRTLDRTWLAAVIVGGALAWMLGQVVLTTRRRIPVYDLAEPVLATTTASES